MGILVACVIVSFIVMFAGLLALWVNGRRRDARLAQLEKQQSVDSFCFAHQARLHNRKISALDERLMYMAREIRSERPTVRPPRS